MKASRYLNVCATLPCAWMFLVAESTSSLCAREPVVQAFALRGEVQHLYHVPAQTQQTQVRPVVLFIPGDGGWRGAAVHMGGMMAALGYEVYGLDVRRYLKGCTTTGGPLTEDQLASDVEQVVKEIATWNHGPVILVGWSQGAAMVILTAARAQHKAAIAGVVTIALPESGFRGWRWHDSLLSLIGLDAREPEFQTAPLLPEVAPIPLYMISGTRDRVTPAAVARRLAYIARHPKRHREVEGGNHRLAGHREELLARLRSGLGWIERRGTSGRRDLTSGAL